MEGGKDPLISEREKIDQREDGSDISGAISKNVTAYVSQNFFALKV